jgi:hypothetical protein
VEAPIRAALQIVCDHEELPACRLGDESGQDIALAHQIPGSIPGGSGFLIEIRQNVPVAITANKLTTAIGNTSKTVSVSIPEYCCLRLHR